MSFDFNASVQVFYAGQRHILNFYSIWPIQKSQWKRLLHNINFWHIFCFWILIFDLILMLHIIVNITDMNEVIKACFVLSTCIAYTLKVFCLKYNNVALLQLFGKLHAAHFCPANVKEKDIFVEARDISRSVRNYYGILSVAALTMLLLTQYAIDNTQLPLATYTPFNVTRGSFGYWLMYFYQCVALSFACFLNISYDSLCCSLFLFVSAQLDMLALRLQRIGYSSNAAMEDVTEIKQQLKHCIEYYVKIVELAAEIEGLVVKPISAQIFCSVLVLTANFYAMSLLSDEKLEFLKYFIYQSCMLIQVFILCYFAGEITQRSLALPHQLYKSNWVHWERNNRKVLLMLMQRLDISIRIRTINASHAFDLALFSSVCILCSVPFSNSSLKLIIHLLKCSYVNVDDYKSL